jgi:amino acid adenylation domain-containing protein
VPIDPGWPPQRRNELMAKSGTTFAVVSADGRESLEFPASIGVVSFAEEMLREIDVNSPLVQRSPDDLAYVIFTSGSTGVPKGVAISHRAAVNTVLHVNRLFSVTAADKVLAVSQLHFDLSVYDIFGLLAVGGALVFPEPALANDPGHWVDLVNRHGITIWDSVPQLLDLLLDANRGAGNLKSLRVAMLSGDWIPLGLPDRLRDLVPTAQFFSLGGATEGSIWSIYFPVGRIDPRWESIPYGTALPNQHMYVLNERHQPCPELVEGDIYIGGDGVALGYWKDEALTQRQFMHSAVTGERIYKTGDMGRWRPDGNIQFLGRRDQQVKIRGFRVELGEIEACLRAQESVREAIVVTRDDAGVGKLLIAYVIPAGADFSLEACRAHVAERLPQYMLPHAFVVLDSVPLTANGKLDRKALPLPQLDRAGPALGAVQSETEAALAETWKKVLNVRNVNREDNFFELGGHSLLAMQVVLAIRERWSVPMPIQALFAAENLAALAARIDDAVNDRDRYRAVRADGKAAQDQQPMDEILL